MLVRVSYSIHQCISTGFLAVLVFFGTKFSCFFWRFVNLKFRSGFIFCFCANMSNSRKRKALSEEEKLANIERYDEESPTWQQKDIAADLGIAGSTSRTILQNREKTIAVVGSSKRPHLKS